MKLKIFNTENSLSTRRAGGPRINFNPHGGITLNEGLTEIMKLQAGDKVEIAQDEEEKSDWYIRKTKDEKGFTLRDKSKQKGLTFNSASICTNILAEVLKDSATIEVAPDAEKDGWHSILTAKFKASK